MNRVHISREAKREFYNMIQLLFYPKTLLLPIFSMGFTLWCIDIGFTSSLSDVTRFFFIGLFFCFGVLVNTADQRRLQAFTSLARMKSLLMTLWQIVLSQKLSKLEKQKVQKHIQGVIPSVKMFLRKEGSHLSPESFHNVDSHILKLTKVVEILRKNGMPSPEISRIYQIIQIFYSEYETLVSIKEYRTPTVLRDFLKISLIVSVFILAPDFANLGYYGVIVSGLVAWFFSSLIEIQSQLEYPFRNHIDDFNDEFLDRFGQRVSQLEK